jgi:hypothetical protein
MKLLNVPLIRVGRFLILSRDGRLESNLGWERRRARARWTDRGHSAGDHESGPWMAHGPIAEHAQNGMMFSSDVARQSETGSCSPKVG